jgi:hypothetical protein
VDILDKTGGGYEADGVEQSMDNAEITKSDPKVVSLLL